MNEQRLRKALHNGLSGIGFDPARQSAVLESIEQRRPMPRRLSLVVALALALMLLGGTAVAAGLGLFGKFAQDNFEGASVDELNRLEDLAIDYDESQTLTIDGRDVTLTLRQAYCDGIRLYFTYEVDGVNIGDGAFLADGSVADIRESGATELEDGTVIGYQTLQLPDGYEMGDTLTFMLTVHGERVPFTIYAGAAGGLLTGSGDFDVYTASAQLRQTSIVLQGSVLLQCPKLWTDLSILNGDDSERPEIYADHIIGYVLTDGRRQWLSNYTSLYPVSDGLLEIGLLFDVPEEMDDLLLVPIYVSGGECPEEAIPLSFDNES